MDKNHHNNYQANSSLNVENEYWNCKLAGSFEMGGFPVDKNLDGDGQYEKGEFAFRIPSDISERIISVSKNSSFGVYAIMDYP